MTTPSPYVQTALRYISAFTPLTPSAFSTLLDPSYSHTFLPPSDVTPLPYTQDSFLTHIASLRTVIASFPVTPTDIFEDTLKNTVIVYATSEIKWTPEVLERVEAGEDWKYDGTYVFRFEFGGEEEEGKIVKVLQRQLQQLKKNPVDGFSAGLVDDDNVYEWEFTIFGPADTLYEEGIFRARMTFPDDFPLNPPKMKFVTEMWHPNIYKNGDVCISILHAPGVDQYGFEDAGERWTPVQSVESILVSVISLLSADPPSTESPANIDAAKQVREDLKGYRKQVRRLVRKSAEEAY
ncbi:hypothetical protein RQP46_003589 [Phenoliferia psychrophenolica]